MTGINDVYNAKPKNTRTWIRKKANANNPYCQPRKVSREMDQSGVQKFSRQVAGAKKKELAAAWSGSNTYKEELLDERKHRNLVSARWVLTWKHMDDKDVPAWVNDETYDATNQRRAKARLVVRGFQDMDLENVEVGSPTTRAQNLHLPLIWAAAFSKKIVAGDVANAFLQGAQIGGRSVQMHPPPEAQCAPGTMWVMLRGVYGPNDAPKLWYEEVRKVALEAGAEINVFDPALLVWRDDCDEEAMQMVYDLREDQRPMHTLVRAPTSGIAPVQVDDFLFVGTDGFHEQVVSRLWETLPFGSPGSPSDYGGMIYSGRYVERHPNSPIQIH